MAKIGKPRKFRTSRALQKQIDRYFQRVESPGCTEIPDVEGLCIHLDISRDCLHRYEKSEKFKAYNDVVARAKTRIFHWQKQLALQGKLNASIFMFNAKNNFGYVEKIEHEHTKDHNINVIFKMPELQEYASKALPEPITAEYLVSHETK